MLLCTIAQFVKGVTLARFGPFRDTLITSYCACSSQSSDASSECFEEADVCCAKTETACQSFDAVGKPFVPSPAETVARKRIICNDG